MVLCILKERKESIYVTLSLFYTGCALNKQISQDPRKKRVFEAFLIWPSCSPRAKGRWSQCHPFDVKIYSLSFEQNRRLRSAVTEYAQKWLLTSWETSDYALTCWNFSTLLMAFPRADNESPLSLSKKFWSASLPPPARNYTDINAFWKT